LKANFQIYTRELFYNFIDILPYLDMLLLVAKDASEKTIRYVLKS